MIDPFVIRIADVTIGVKPYSDLLVRQVAPYVHEGSPSVDFSVEVTKEDCERDETEFIALLRKVADRLVNYNVLLFHSSLMSVDGFGYAYTAPSGTGKSTHTALLRKHYKDRVTVVNDDKPFIRITDKGIFAYGSPWSGQHHLQNNIRVPLKGISVLHRGEENSVEKADLFTAYTELLQQIHRPAETEGAAKALNLINKVLEQVPIYELYCNMEEEAAVLSYETMSGLHFEDLLEKDGEFVYKTLGVSMEPLLHANSDVVRIKKTEEPLKRGDIVLYKHLSQPNRYILHRILHVNGDDTYDIIGDNCYLYERNIPKKRILGKMVSYVHKGKERTLTSFSYKLYCFFFVTLAPCRILLFRLRAFIRRTGSHVYHWLKGDRRGSENK